MMYNIAVLILSMFACNMLFKLYRKIRAPKTIRKIKQVLDLRPLIIRFYKRSVKFICNSCGNAQTAFIDSRCHNTGFCSRCLQKKWRHGKVAYWE